MQPIDPFAVGEPWRGFFQSALQAQARYRQTLSNIMAGPLREHLEDIGRHVEDGVQQCWRLAQRASALEDGASALERWE